MGKQSNTVKLTMQLISHNQRIKKNLISKFQLSTLIERSPGTKVPNNRDYGKKQRGYGVSVLYQGSRY